MTERKSQLRLTNPAFKYTRSESTDIRKTFAKARARLRREAKAKPKNGSTA